MSTTNEALTGGCLCGAIRYEVKAEPLMMASCHCRDCQKATGAAYFPALAVPAAALRVQGEPKTFAVKGESGNTVTRAFCGRCGSTLWGWSAAMPDGRSLSATSLDDPRRFTPAVHIFTASAQPWDYLPPGAPQFERMPPRPA
ncbi:MAG: GFA family protein [Deltaproteobacteria bacterium]|nr:GFA family protein [Deltaproteobacteria bacterium]